MQEFFSQHMKAIVYDAPRQFQYKDVPEPKIESDDVLVRIDACGLCGTDLHIHEGEFAPRFPFNSRTRVHWGNRWPRERCKRSQGTATGGRKQQRIVRQMLLLPARRFLALPEFASLRRDAGWRIRPVSADKGGPNFSDRQSLPQRSGHGGTKLLALSMGWKCSP